MRSELRSLSDIAEAATSATCRHITSWRCDASTMLSLNRRDCRFDLVTLSLTLMRNGSLPACDVVEAWTPGVVSRLRLHRRDCLGGCKPAVLRGSASRRGEVPLLHFAAEPSLPAAARPKARTGASRVTRSCAVWSTPQPKVRAACPIFLERFALMANPVRPTLRWRRRRDPAQKSCPKPSEPLRRARSASLSARGLDGMFSEPVSARPSGLRGTLFLPRASCPLSGLGDVQFLRAEFGKAYVLTISRGTGSAWWPQAILR